MHTYSSTIAAITLTFIRQSVMILDKKYIFKLIVGLMIYNLVILNASSAAPYPPSPIFESIEWDFSTHKRTASGSDLWATTWAADGNLYSTWGDGGGFGGDDSKGRVYLGVARIEGSGTSWAGYNVFGGYNGEVSADFIGKANSIISVDGSLYISVTEEGKWQRSKIGRSDDNGKTWVFNNGSFANSSWDFAETGGAFSGPSYIQFGKDNSGALDNYIYLYSRKTKTSSETEMLLARVDKTKIQVRSAYEFYSGIDENGAPLWTSDLSLAKSVFTDSQNGVNWGHASFYHPIYKRYILTMRQNDSNGRNEAGQLPLSGHR